MPLALYMDQNVPRAITLGLRLRDVDVLTAFEDGTSDADDPALLDRASALGRVLFSHDDDLLAEAARRQAASIFSQTLSPAPMVKGVPACSCAALVR